MKRYADQARSVAALVWLKRLDARVFQVAFLLSLLLFGAMARDFALQPQQVALAFTSALGTQALWQHGLRLPSRHGWGGYLSAVVSACGISILVRADSLWVHPLLAAVAMSSKFVLRAGQGAARGHFLNPANLAAVLALLVMPGAWLSPGQWGQELLAGLWMVLLGAVVSGRVSRLGVSATLLATWLGLVALRLAWLGFEPALAWAMWQHQALNGALILFAFFMVTDPMTTPQHPRAACAYAAAVAVAAFVWQFVLFKPQGLIVALFGLSFLVPLANRVWPAARFNWQAAQAMKPRLLTEKLPRLGSAAPN